MPPSKLSTYKMNDNALYFPYISVPNEKWTLKTLLYWDKLASIVPMEHMGNPEKLTPFMRELVHQDLVRQVFPAEYIYQINEFEACFIELIEKRLASRTSDSIGDKHRSLIHVEKLGSIPYFLVERNLATKVDSSWYNVDTWVANLFMAYLATCLSFLEDINAVPVTSQIKFASIYGNLNPSARSVANKHHIKSRDVILREILPVPDEKVCLDKLLRFKEDHGHLLPALRRKVEAHCSTIATLDYSESRITATESFIADCKYNIDEIADAMSPSWKKLIFGSLTPLYGTGLVLAGSVGSNDLALAGAGALFIESIYKAVSSIPDDNDRIFTRPMAYAAHARSELLA